MMAAVTAGRDRATNGGRENIRTRMATHTTVTIPATTAHTLHITSTSPLTTSHHRIRHHQATRPNTRGSTAAVAAGIVARRLRLAHVRCGRGPWIGHLRRWGPPETQVAAGDALLLLRSGSSGSGGTRGIGRRRHLPTECSIEQRHATNRADTLRFRAALRTRRRHPITHVCRCRRRLH